MSYLPLGTVCLIVRKSNYQGPNPKGLFKHSAVKALILKSLFQGSNKGKSLAYHLYARSPEYLKKLLSPLRFEVFALAGAAVSSLLQCVLCRLC